MRVLIMPLTAISLTLCSVPAWGATVLFSDFGPPGSLYSTGPGQISYIVSGSGNTTGGGPSPRR